MIIFLKWLLIGFGCGFVLFPIGLGIINLIRNTLERRKIKKMIKNGQFLSPIDSRDYDSKMWANQITPKSKEDMDLITKQIFIKPKEEIPLQSQNKPQNQ